MQLISFLFIVIVIIPGFIIMRGALWLHKYIVAYKERTTGKVSKSYTNFLAFIIILIASILIFFVSLYMMKITSSFGDRII